MQTFKFSRTIDYELNVLPTEKPGLKAFQLKYKDPSVPGRKPVTGFCVSKDLKSLKQGLVASTMDWELAKPELLTYLQKWGWTGKNGNYTHFVKYAYGNKFQATKQGRGILVKPDQSSHMMFDMNKKPLPVAIHCDYISACMNNNNYDMNLAFEILQKRDDIHFITDHVSDIPYYNNESGLDTYLCFLWQASVEDYRRMWKQCLEMVSAGRSGHPSCRRYEAIFKEDLLGLRKGGAAKHDSFWGSQ